MIVLEYMKKTKGIGLIVREPGAGKTFTLRCFAESLNPFCFRLFIYLCLQSNVFGFLPEIGISIRLGEDPKFRKEDLFNQIQEAVKFCFKEIKITPVFILDVMQLAKGSFSILI
ncbi:MAG: ATP-binding protein [Tepidanaerobacteraceae bacterium]